MRIKTPAFARTWPALAGNLLALCLFTSSFTFVCASPAQEEYLQTQRLTTALGKILLSHKSTRALLTLCAEHYPHLSGSVSLAQAHLVQVNQPLVDKARAIQQHLVQSIARQQSMFDAEKFSLEIDLAVQNAITQFKRTLASYKQQEQHYVCNRLVLSVQAGEWDIQVREPEASRTINDFE